MTRTINSTARKVKRGGTPGRKVKRAAAPLDGRSNTQRHPWTEGQTRSGTPGRKVKHMYQSYILLGPRPKSCYEILQNKPSVKGRDYLYMIYVDGDEKYVYCDMTTDGGGWTVIQRKEGGPMDFDQTWDKYKEGFGNPSNNHWIGNDIIYTLTKNKDQELLINFEDASGDRYYAKYSTFHVECGDNQYKLTVSGFKGSVDITDFLSRCNGMFFTTKDRDHDKSYQNCANKFRGGWWFNTCSYAYPNNALYEADTKVYWGTTVYKNAVMMVRPKKC